ncbi:hypothetical protein D3C81_1891720 [compost metagenome]
MEPTGLIIRSTMAIAGVTSDFAKDGRLVVLTFSSSAASSSVTLVPLYLIMEAMITATITPQIAGIKPPSITWFTSSL